MENNKNFTEMSLDDLKKVRKILDDLHGNNIKDVVNYGDDEEKFNNSINELIKYIKQLIEDGNFHLVFLRRVQAGVYYGEYHSGIPDNKGLINLNNADGLKRIFDAISNEFKEKFSIGGRHTFGKGWTPVSTICDSLMLDVESTEDYDHIWFYDYTHKKGETNNRSK